MRSLPPEPNPGDKVSASLIRELIRAIRSLMPIQGPGMKISTGPNGTTYSAKAVSVAKPSSGEGNPLFAIRNKETETGDDESEPSKAIVNCYWQVGGVMHHMDDVYWDDDFNDGYLCLRCGASNGIVCYENETTLHTAQLNQDTYVRPLYVMEDGAVKLDLRTMFMLQEIELGLT